MKNNSLKFLCSLLALLFVVSCEKDYPPSGVIPPDQTVSFVDNGVVELAFDNSSQKYLLVSAKDGVAWRVESDQSWLKLSTSQEAIGYSFVSGRGSNMIYLIADTYSSGDGSPREAKVKIDGSSTFATVRQLRSGELETSVEAITFGKGAATRSMEISVEDNTKEWTLKPVDSDGVEVDWVELSISQPTQSAVRSSITAAGTKEVKVTVLANDEQNPEERTAKVQLDGETLFEVKQTTSDFVAVEDLGFENEDIEEHALTLAATLDYTLETAITPSTATDKLVRYESSNPAIATVDNNGVIHAIAPGEVNISVIAGDNTNGDICENVELTITASVPVTGVTIGNIPTIGIGKEYTATCTVTPENATNKNVTWSISTSIPATIDPVTGVITGVAQGAPTITVTTEDGNFTTSRMIYVQMLAESVEITGEGVADKKVTIPLYGSTTFTANVLPADTFKKDVTWTLSGNEDGVVTVSDDGSSYTITGDKAGTVKLKATSQSVSTLSDEIEVTVEKIALTSLTIDNIVLPLTKSKTIDVVYDPVAPSYTGVTYSCAPEGVISIDDDGVVTQVGEPAVDTVVTVTASSTEPDSTVSTTFTVTIAAAPIEYALGDLYPNAVSPVGIVFWVDPTDASKGKVMSTTNVEKKVWSTTAELVGASSITDGAANTTAILEMSDSATKYPGFAAYKVAFVDTKPGDLDWYVPAYVEMKAIYALIFGLNDETGVDTWITDGPGGKFAGSLDDDTLKANFKAFNAQYKNGDKEITGYDNLSAGYWCSTEGKLDQSDPTTHVIFLSTGGLNFQEKEKVPANSMTQFIRPVAKFGY